MLGKVDAEESGEAINHSQKSRRDAVRLRSGQAGATKSRPVAIFARLLSTCAGRSPPRRTPLRELGTEPEAFQFQTVSKMEFQIETNSLLFSLCV